MKRIFLLLLSLIATTFLYAEDLYADTNPVTFSVGVGTGCIVYGDNDIPTSLSNSSRAIFSDQISFDFSLTPYMRLLFGFDNVNDLVFSGDEHIYHIDYAFLGGFKFYTPFDGFTFSIAYALGRRSDFYALEDDSGDVHKYSDDSKWGNGYKFCLDYDFAVLTDNFFMPAVGIYWRNMPRGGSRDNLISVYCRFHF